MTQDFSPAWKSSKNRRKQRKYAINAPIHIKRKFLSAQLSKTLKQKYNTNSFILKKGDKVKVMRGQFKPQMGTIESVDVENSKIKVETIFTSRRDGTKAFIPIHASNIQIQELNLEDRKRKTKIESYSKTNQKEERKVIKK
jgi:large subunit ribosomal protein L24